MNFDLNAISSLMQLLAKQAPPKQEPPRGQTAGISSFVKQNGIGEKVDLTQKQNSNSANPLAGILEMMGAPQGGDAMSALMPMLMNMLKKPEAPIQNPSTSKKNDGAEYPQTPNSSPQYDRLREEAACGQDHGGSLNRNAQFGGYAKQEYGEKTPRRDEQALGPANAEKFVPISFAGYALISALNILYNHTKMRGNA